MNLVKGIFPAVSNVVSIISTLVNDKDNDGSSRVASPPANAVNSPPQSRRRSNSVNAPQPPRKRRVFNEAQVQKLETDHRIAATYERLVAQRAEVCDAMQQTAEQFGVSPATVFRKLQNMRKRGTLIRQPGCGRP